MSPEADLYCRYLQKTHATIDPVALARVEEICAATHWETPQSANDWNNIAVLALIAAEETNEATEFQAHLNSAITALSHAHQPQSGSICTAHVALLHYLLGDMAAAITEAMSAFINFIPVAYTLPEKTPLALVYLPVTRLHQLQKSLHRSDAVSQLLLASDGATQLLMFLGEVLSWTVSLADEARLRLLELAHNVWPHSAIPSLRLGVASVVSQRLEGLLHLHHAVELAPRDPFALQVLYLAYRDLNAQEPAAFWLDRAREMCSNGDDPSWLWSQQRTDAGYTFVPYEALQGLAVEPTLLTTLTPPLITEDDWCEPEMDLWREWIGPGMTVIDVGANIGMYTCSAAVRVEAEGRVIAVEPVADCIICLRETIRLNNLAQISVHQAAASDHEGSVQLLTTPSSDMNRVVSLRESMSLPPESVTTVPCTTLDSICEREGVSRVDFLKIDVEGYEQEVLQGAVRLLEEWTPVIFYENSMTQDTSNTDVAAFLQARNYQLFRYHAFAGELTSIDSEDAIRGVQNVIAIPQQKVAQFIPVS